MARRRGRRRLLTTQRIPTIAVVALVVGLAFLMAKKGGSLGDDAPSTADPGAASVVRVVDGDTMVVRLDGGDEKLRLIGIDTPESVATDRPNECFGKEATAQLTKLLPPGTAIRIARDVEPRDRYDRLLGYVYRARDNLFVNEDMVANGFAEAKEYPPNTAMEGPLETAESRARAAKAGFWGACGSADVPL